MSCDNQPNFILEIDRIIKSQKCHLQMWESSHNLCKMSEMISYNDQILLLNSSQKRSLNLTKQKLKSDPYCFWKANSHKKFMTYRHFDSFLGEAFSSFLIHCWLFVCGFLSLSVLNTGLLIKYHESVSFIYTGTMSLKIAFRNLMHLKQY